MLLVRVLRQCSFGLLIRVFHTLLSLPRVRLWRFRACTATLTSMADGGWSPTGLVIVGVVPSLSFYSPLDAFAPSPETFVYYVGLSSSKRLALWHTLACHLRSRILCLPPLLHSCFVRVTCCQWGHRRRPHLRWTRHCSCSSRTILHRQTSLPPAPPPAFVFSGESHADLRQPAARPRAFVSSPPDPFAAPVPAFVSSHSPFADVPQQVPPRRQWLRAHGVPRAAQMSW